MKSDFASVGGPCGRDGFRKEWSGGAAERGFDPQFFVALAIVGSEPDLTSVSREADIADDFVVQVNGVAALGHVTEIAATDQREPGIKNSVPVGKEYSELSIRRHGRIELSPFEVGKAAELGIGKRIDPEDIRPIKKPTRNNHRDGH